MDNGRYGSFQNGTFSEGMQKNVMEMKMDTLIAGLYFKPGAMGLIEISEPWGFVCVRSVFSNYFLNRKYISPWYSSGRAALM